MSFIARLHLPREKVALFPSRWKVRSLAHLNVNPALGLVLFGAIKSDQFPLALRVTRSYVLSDHNILLFKHDTGKWETTLI